MNENLASTLLYLGGAAFVAALGWWSWRDARQAKRTEKFDVPLFGSITKKGSPGLYGSLLALRTITFWMAVPMTILLIAMWLTDPITWQ